MENASEEEVLTIDQLSMAAGVPARTIREYQRLELLPSPSRKGRIGIYGREHRRRLSVIARLQKRGYSLAAIGDLMGSWEQGQDLGAILGLDADRVVLDEPPTVIDQRRLVEMVPAFADPLLVDHAIASGALHRHDDNLVARSLAALRLIGVSIDSGLSPEEAVAMIAGVRAGAETVADSVVGSLVASASNSGERTAADLVSMLIRARLLLAQAVASLVVHEVGVGLRHHAGNDPDGPLSDALATATLGKVRRFSD